MNILIFKNWSTRSLLRLICILFGCILLINALFNFGINLYGQSLIEAEDGGYWKYAEFINDYQVVFIISYFVGLFAKCTFFIGIVPLLFSSKRLPIIIGIVLVFLLYNIYNFYSPETFKLNFTVENYKFSSFIVHMLITVIMLVLYAIYFVSAKRKLVKVGSLMWLIAQSISFISLIIYAIMFTIDSTYFMDNNKLFIEILGICNNYLRTVLFIIGITFLIFEVCKLNPSAEETNKNQQ